MRYALACLLVFFAACTSGETGPDIETMTDFGARYTAAWSSHDAVAVASFYGADGSLTVNDGEPAVGREAIAVVAQSFMTAFPDFVLEMDSLRIESGIVEYHWTFAGTNTGPGGTGNPVRFSGHEEWTMGSGGLVAESQGHFDAAEYKRQLEVGLGGMEGEAPTAERIVARVASAMTAGSEIEDLKTLRIRMVYADHEYPVVTEIRRPNRMRTEGVGNYVLVFDGERGAFLESPPAEDGTPQDPALVDSRYLRDLELDIAFAFPAFFDYPAEYLGRELVNGVESDKLGVTLPLGVRMTYFVNTESHLPVRVLADVTVDGTEYHPGRAFSDYEDWGGLMYPRTVTYWWMPDGVETAVVESVEVDVPLGEDRFDIPADIQATVP
jgi:hypothetical protein